jgi:hypothetical protein
VQQLLQWRSNKYYIFWVCVCSLRYPACNAHAPYCHLWPARLYNIFPHYLIKDTIFERKNLLDTKCVFWFSVQLLSETNLIIIITKQDTITWKWPKGPKGVAAIQRIVCIGCVWRYLNPLCWKLTGRDDKHKISPLAERFVIQHICFHLADSLNVCPRYCNIGIHPHPLGMGHLSSRELYEGNLAGELLYWGPRRIC